MRSATAAGFDTEALWGVMVTPGWVQNGDVAGSGSVSKTSSVAAFSVPSPRQRSMSASFCRPPPAGVQHHRPAEVAVAGQRVEQGRIEDAARRGGEGQQHDEDLRAGQERLPARVTREGVEAGYRLRGAAPARDVETHRLQLAGGILAEDAEPHHADPHILGGRLRVVVVPQFLGLLALVAGHLTVVAQDVEDAPFAHPGGKIRIDDAHDRHVRQARIAQQVVDAGPEREDRLQSPIGHQRSRRMPPGHDRADPGRVGFGAL